MTPQATRYIQVVDERTVAEDLFSFDAFVVTIKTGARPYGAISRQFVAHYPTVPIADVSHGNSSAPIDLPDGKKVIFTCLWPDVEAGEGYPPEKIVACTASAIMSALKAGLEEIALPRIGGGKARERKPAMGQGIVEAEKMFQHPRWRDIEPPEVIVTIGKRNPSP